MTRPLLIGQAPGPNTRPELPLYPVPESSAGGRLVKFMGIMRHQYLSHFDRCNLLYEFPGQHKRDDKFPLVKARIAAAAMAPLLAGRQVILVGRNVATAFNYELEDLPWHTWLNCGRLNARVVCVPHPSGRNQWYNKPENRDIARAFWQELLASSS